MIKNNVPPAPGIDPFDQGYELDVSGLSGRLGYNLRRTYAAVLDDLSKALEQYDIRPRQYGILLTVHDNPGVSQGQVASALGIARTNFVPMVDKLEKRGLLKRKPSAVDRRYHLLHLTEKGMKLTAVLRDADAQHEAALREIISERASDELIKVLKRIRHHLSGNGDTSKDGSDT